MLKEALTTRRKFTVEDHEVVEILLWAQLAGQPGLFPTTACS
jgi:hypothetical protein